MTTANPIAAGAAAQTERIGRPTVTPLADRSPTHHGVNSSTGTADLTDSSVEVPEDSRGVGRPGNRHHAVHGRGDHIDVAQGGVRLQDGPRRCCGIVGRDPRSGDQCRSVTSDDPGLGLSWLHIAAWNAANARNTNIGVSGATDNRRRRATIAATTTRSVGHRPVGGHRSAIREDGQGADGDWTGVLAVVRI